MKVQGAHTVGTTRICIIFHFFCTLATFSLPAVGLFPLSRLRRTQGGRRLTLRRMFGPRPGLGPGRVPWHVLWEPKFARAGSFFKGSLSATPSHAGPSNPHIFSFSLCSCYHAVPPALTRSTLSQPRYNSSRTSSSSLRGGHRPCFYVCACVPGFLSYLYVSLVC